MSTVIDVQHISKSFGRVQAVRNISFAVQAGEIFGLLGPNGAGKTTTLSIIEGLMAPDEGRVRVLGLDVTTQTRAVKARIGVQLQETSLIDELRVHEQMELFARLYGRSISRDEIEELLAMVGLQSKANAYPSALSGGQKQRLSLALALVNEPEILFLDEPTAGLDPQARRHLWEIILALREQGRTIVLTTHYIEEAEALCQRVGVMAEGELIALDAPETLIERHRAHIISSESSPIRTHSRRSLNLEDVYIHLTGRRLRA